MNSPQASNPADAPDLTIEDATDLFINRNRPNWKGETERSYRKALDTFEEFTAEEGLETLGDLDLWQVGQYTDFLLAKDYARVTVLGKQKQARRCLKWLESQGYLRMGMHLAIETLKLEDNEQTSNDILRPDEMQEILAAYRESMQWRATRRHALLEVIAHTGARRSCIRALDVRDYDQDARTLTFLNRPETDTRLKRGDTHQRKVVLSEEPNEVLREYMIRERRKRNDEHGRTPLFASARGRPAKQTITKWAYTTTFPCLRQECPHGKEPFSCPYKNQNDASKCPSTTSPHPMRRGSITWQLNIGRSIQDVADRAATTPDVIRRYYDQPDLDEDLQRRITSFDGIDICEHTDPTDINEEIDQ